MAHKVMMQNKNRQRQSRKGRMGGRGEGKERRTTAREEKGEED